MEGWYLHVINAFFHALIVGNEIQILNLAREVFCFCLKKKKNETKEQNNLRLYNYIAIYINCDYFPLRSPSREVTGNEVRRLVGTISFLFTPWSREINSVGIAIPQYLTPLFFSFPSIYT